jgi:serine/threonine-protein kinase
MAEVLEAEDTVLGRAVAIKVLKRAARKDGEELEGEGGAADEAHAADRMRVEARALALVAHPNIVAVIDFGTTTDERPFIVTERLRGRSLDAELHERGALPWEEAVDVVLGVLAALEAVHTKGIVHRDIKPGNVFLCTGGIVKLLDFGVAKMLGEASAKHVAPAYRTKEGALVGTPQYITPEQAHGDPVDARTDLYAVGLLLYSLITGRHPFEDGQDIVQVVKAMREEGAPLPSKHAPLPIPQQLDRAVSKALAWNALERFQSAGAFAEVLRGIRGPAENRDEATLLMPPARRRLSRAGFVLVAAASAALVFAALVLSTGGAR